MKNNIEEYSDFMLSILNKQKCMVCGVYQNREDVFFMGCKDCTTIL
tara:strand:+ start:84 stop:221 length:138 start_codon:yes stop_codon:yes gene_type:complete